MMRWVANVMGHELLAERGGENQDNYFLRVPVADSDAFGAVHNLHRRIPLGRWPHWNDAISEARRLLLSQ